MISSNTRYAIALLPLVAIAACDDPPGLASDYGGAGYQYFFAEQNITDLSAYSWPSDPSVTIGGTAKSWRLDQGEVGLFCSEPYFGGCGMTDLVHGDGQWHDFGAFNSPQSYEIYVEDWFHAVTLDQQPFFPEDVTAPAAHPEGIAHGDGSLFVSTIEQLFKLDTDLNVLASTGIPFADGRNHIGDVDFRDGRLYVPLEMKGDDHSMDPPARLAIVDANLNPVMYNDFPMSVQRAAGWVAVHPMNGLIFARAEDGAHLNVYELRDHTQTLQHVYTVKLDQLPAGGMGNGAAFSDTGHLFIADKVDGCNMTVSEYLVVGRNAQQVSTGTFSMGLCDGIHKEIYAQGIDVWNMDQVPDKNPGFVGQIHVPVFNWDWFSDNWSIAHFNVSDVSLL